MLTLNSFLMDGVLTVPEAAVTLMAKMRSIRRKAGQTAVEYLLTTLVLVTVFAGFYGFMQGQLKRLFIGAAVRILTSYY